jgi:hypothetical protein
MSNNDLFTNSQYGFRPGRSCVTQLLEVLDDWSELMDNGFSIDTIYLDFCKAFDSLPNQRLLLKLEKLENVLVISKNFNNSIHNVW